MSKELTPHPELGHLQCIEHNGDFVFTAEEIGRQLGYADPRDSINKVYQRNVQELQDYSSTVSLTVEGIGERTVRVFTEEGVYILSFLAQTDRAASFRRQVAAFLKDLRQRKLTQARLEGVAQVANAITSLKPELFEKLWQIKRYRDMGLTSIEMGKLLSASQASVEHWVRKAKALGLLEAL